MEEREQEQMDEGGPYGSRADSQRMSTITAQKKQAGDFGDSDFAGPVNVYDRSIHLEDGTRTDEKGVKLQWPNW